MVMHNSLFKRIIPKILVSYNPKVGIPQSLTTKYFENFRFMGDPVSQALIFQSNGADELFLVNIESKKIDHSQFRSIIEKVNKKIFMPLTVGGGISTFRDAASYFDLGVEKIVLERILNDSPEEVSKIVRQYGSQSIIGSCSYWGNGEPPVAHPKISRFQNSNLLLEKIRFMENIGVGEILLNDVSRDGTRLGTNLSVLQQVLGATNLPIIDSCGFGKTSHFIDSLKMGSSAIAIGTYFAFVDQSFLQLRSQLITHGVRVRT